MPAKDVRVYSVGELERLAEKYLEDQFGPVIPIPIDVDLLVEKAEGLDLDYYPKLKANHGILGGVWRDVDSGAIFIYIDEDLADNDSRTGWAQYRMTVAEELAHVHLHRKLIEGIEAPADFHALHNHPQWDDIERNAKRFAAAILMPAAELGKEAGRTYEQIVRRPEIHPRIHEADAPRKWTNPVKKWLCQRLAVRFEVSETTMDHRLGEWPARVYERVERSLDAGTDSLI